MNTKESLQEISLRIKYENFAKLSTELSKAQSFQDVAAVLQINLKYIFNFTSYRILAFYEQEKIQFEIARQYAVVKQDEIAILPITAEVIRTNITIVLTEQQLHENKEHIYTMFQPPHNKNLCIYPVRVSEHQYIILGGGNKEDQSPLDSDYRFLRLVGETLLSKLSQLILKNQLELRVHRRTEQLNQANQELSSLFYRASHDFNAPLTTLLGLAQLGRMQLSQPQEILILIEQSTGVIRQAQNMLKKFKVISEAEVQEAEIERITVTDFLQQKVNQFSSKAQENQIQLFYKAFGREHIHFSIEILSALLDNLVENAIHFHKKDNPRFITIEINAVPSMLKVHVIDNGIGIAEDQQARIFDLYTRGHESSKGNGLGLYLVKRIVEKLKGSVQVKSKQYEGSHFTLTIPLMKY